MQQLPSALERREEIFRRLEGKTRAIFLDFDGTLTPIVDDPAQAILSEDTRRVIQRLSAHCTVAVISGRDVAEVRTMVAIGNVAYAGSHGFDIIGPDGSPLLLGRWQHFLRSLDRAETELRQVLEGICGLHIERKRLALAVHYRSVAAEHIGAVEKAVDRLAAQEENLKKAGGKKLFELRPNIDWGKGKALLYLLEGMALAQDEVVPLFIGDDVTDEDAFVAIRERGIGIVVMGEKERETVARYALQDPVEVRRFLEYLNASMEERSP